MKFQDYYETLGITREAKPEEIQRAYRKLAKKYHPDINKSKDAQEKFKQINEANEVLGDPEKRKRYDTLGANWQAGQDFTLPPGWEEILRNRGARGQSQAFSGMGGGGSFSDFFQAFFGGAGPGSKGFSFDFGGAGPFSQAAYEETEGEIPPTESEMQLSVEELYQGGSKNLSFEITETNPRGEAQRTTKTYKVRIPPGTSEGAVIRLSGQGLPRQYGGKKGDLLLKVRIQPDPNYQVQGSDLIQKLHLSPWEAALGAKVPLRIPGGGELSLTVPPGSGSGTKLRVKGKGLPKNNTERGDLYAELLIQVPQQLSAQEKELFQRLAQVSAFKPRAGN